MSKVIIRKMGNNPREYTRHNGNSIKYLMDYCSKPEKAKTELTYQETASLLLAIANDKPLIKHLKKLKDINDLPLVKTMGRTIVNLINNSNGLSIPLDAVLYIQWDKNTSKITNLYYYTGKPFANKSTTRITIQ